MTFSFATTHPGLAWLRRSEAGAAWLASLPRLVAECAERWSLRPGEPYPYAYASLVMPADVPSGPRAVLKIQFPDRECEHDDEALRWWVVVCAVRSYAPDTGI